MEIMIENISTIVMAFSAIVSTAATVVLAILTGKYVRLTQQMVEGAYKPEVVVRLLHEGVRTVQTAPTEFTDKRTIILSIKNVGPGVARKIKLIFLKSTQKSVSINGLSIRGYENAKKC